MSGSKCALVPALFLCSASFFVGGLFGGGGTAATPTATAHTGGVIGVDNLSMRNIHPAVFTPGKMKMLGGSLQSKSGVSVSVNVTNNVSNAQASADVSRDGAGNMDLNIVIEEIENKMARNVSRGEGLAPTMERRYRLNPAAGSYR